VAAQAVVRTQETAAGGAGLRWYQGLTRYQWAVLAIAALGWLFDTMDQNIFNLVRQPAVTALLYPGIPAALLTKAQQAVVTSASGHMTTIFLLGWATGGFLFGMLGDRLGRTRTMILTILVYAIFTGLSGLTHTLWLFGLFRFLTALGVGGEWAAGAAIVAEVFPQRSRAMALGMLQALSAVGNMLAALITLALANPAVGASGWRWAFAVGALPALLVLWIRRTIHEPERWERAKAEAETSGGGKELGAVWQLFSDRLLRRNTLAATLMAAAGVGGLWGVGFWTPELTKVALTPLHLDSVRLAQVKSLVFLVQQMGAFFGIYAYAAFSERTNRRQSLLVFFLLSFAAIQGMFWTANSFLSLMLWAPVLGFCTLGPFSAYTVYFPELYPTRLRATGCGFCYNCARVLAAFAPTALGQLALHFEDPARPGFGFRMATSLVACIYVLGLIGLAFAPETKGKPLPE